MTDLTSVKQRFGIIGTSELLDRALDVALRVAPTDLTVLVTGESGVGKEFFPQVIHAYSARKHNKYIAVNCAAIPEGTIDSELFGHEKGSFTGALEARKGYFEEADGGTIFLDEVAELPHPTQARLLRVLQTGEFMRVGSSKVQKTNVRVVAATNVNLQEAIVAGRFREDLYYRLATVPITVPALRERPEDIPLLFRRFAADVATQYRMPAVTLDDAARQMLMNYYWRGNIRQLKNVAEQISAIEQTRVITPEILAKYLPEQHAGTPMAGALEGECYDNGKLTRFGYVTLTARKDNLLCHAGESIPAHEFHHWDCTDPWDGFLAEKATGRSWPCAVATDRLYAGYPHFHFRANPAFARRFYETCLKERHTI